MYYFYVAKFSTGATKIFRSKIFYKNSQMVGKNCVKIEKISAENFYKIMLKNKKQLTIEKNCGILIIENKERN